jgi:AcrR family transcriptional regulator
MSRGPQTPAPRARLTRDGILRAALDVADTQGIDALKMRELARALGFEAMALYRHVANKGAILDGVLDLVLAEIEPAPDSADWADSIRSSAISLHAALDRHTWAASLLTTPAGLRPARLRFMESLLARLEAAGFPDHVCYHAYHVLDAYVIGFSLWQAGHALTAEEQAAVAERLAQEVSLDDYPRLVRHGEQHVTPGPHRDLSAFEIGLDLMLEGLKEMRETARSTTAERAATRPRDA